LVLIPTAVAYENPKQIEQPYLAATYPTYVEVKATDKEIDHNGIILSQQRSRLGYNCWEYAKSKRKLPQGLWTLKNKQDKIKTKEPSIGSVGVTKEGHVGHLVIVEEIRTESIVISEGNYRTGFITWREVPKNLILGYI